MSSEELANILNFTVGKEGVGWVQFSGLTDVRNLDLDKIIEFKQGEAHIYPDKDHPSIGQGLNKAAIICLEKCFLLDKAKRRVADPTKIERYKSKLKYKVENTRFISYDEESGNWVFSVDHF